jgi:formylglycine-generating enzyme required for sulfatase activity
MTPSGTDTVTATGPGGSATATVTLKAPAPLPPPPTEAGNQWKNPKDGLIYVRMPAGSFMTGCSPGDSECSDREKPARRVTIAAFSIGQTPVTQEAYQQVTGTNPSYFRGAKLPVENVRWNEAQNYCKAVGMTLPTETQWEYAARAGTTGARYGPLDAIAWYDGNSNKTTHPVGQKLPNAWGLYDMLGNVVQWTASDYDTEHKALRGGSFDDSARSVRVSFRGRGQPDSRDLNFGFRCVGE